VSGRVRHFLDLIDIAPTELRGMIDAGRAMKRVVTLPPRGRWPAKSLR
jgi:hypothetical protein